MDIQKHFDQFSIVNIPAEVAQSVQLEGSTLPIRQIIAIGLNYEDHASEQGAKLPERPMLFSKNIASLNKHGDPIVMPVACEDKEQVDYEAELAVVIGKTAKNVSREDALNHVLGYCCANDVSARWWQIRGSGRQFFRGKSFDTFCPIGPKLVSQKEIGDPQNLKIQSRLNGELMQDSSTKEMIFSVEDLITELSRDLSLIAGTIILTGTPAGVGFARTPPVFLKAGDTIEIEIEKIGCLANHVV